MDESLTGRYLYRPEAGAHVRSLQRTWWRDWALWQLPLPVIVLVLFVIAAGVGGSALSAFVMPVELSHLTVFALLAACAWATIELTRSIERKRSYMNKPYVSYVDTKSVWSFAAVIVLPPILASTMVVLTYLIAWFRVTHPRAAVPYRWTYSCATILISTQLAALVLAQGMHNYPGTPGVASLTGLSDFGFIILAALLRWGVNIGLVMLAIALANPSARVGELFTNFSEQVLEAGALGLGLVTAAVVLTSPFVLPGVVIALVALHRSLLVHQYEMESRTDAKTGLATVTRWHEFAMQTLTRTNDRSTSMGLLIIDIDYFKAINDTYGHPFGDEALKAIAGEFKEEIRDDDACGRWGGEEFTVTIPNVGTSQNLLAVAERIRGRVEAISMEPPSHVEETEPVSLTVSIGAAMYPAEGITSLDELLMAADGALYHAKQDGRNRVRLCEEPSPRPTAVADPRPDTEPTS